MPNFSSLGRLEVPEKFLWVVGGWGGVCKVIFVVNPTVVLRLGLGWGFDNLVFLTFNVSLFALNQTADFSSSEFAILKILVRSRPDTWKVVSSAKSSVKKSVALGRSFMNNRKRSGPKTEPWGTPHLIIFFSDSVPFMQTNCSLFLR